MYKTIVTLTKLQMSCALCIYVNITEGWFHCFEVMFVQRLRTFANVLRSTNLTNIHLPYAMKLNEFLRNEKQATVVARMPCGKSFAPLHLKIC
jgi:hypothetical protein